MQETEEEAGFVQDSREISMYDDSTVPVLIKRVYGILAWLQLIRMQRYCNLPLAVEAFLRAQARSKSIHMPALCFELRTQGRQLYALDDSEKAYPLWVTSKECEEQVSCLYSYNEIELLNWRVNSQFQKQTDQIDSIKVQAKNWTLRSLQGQLRVVSGVPICVQFFGLLSPTIQVSSLVRGYVNRLHKQAILKNDCRIINSNISPPQNSSLARFIPKKNEAVTSEKQLQSKFILRPVPVQAKTVSMEVVEGRLSKQGVEVLHGLGHFITRERVVEMLRTWGRLLQDKTVILLKTIAFPKDEVPRLNFSIRDSVCQL